MKRVPHLKKLEETLRTSRIVARGFLGEDRRILEEILESDAAELARLGRTREEIAARMQELTKAARKGLGTSVALDERREGILEDHRGMVVCPWPHSEQYTKTITTVRRTDTGELIRWSDLSIHLIGAHGFFQGRGSPFRLEPGDLVYIIFG